MKIKIRNPNPKQGPIRLHIKHLVLEGLPLTADAAARVQAAVAAELSRHLAASGTAKEFQAGDTVPFVRGGGLRLAPGLDLAHLGIRIAQAIHAGIGGRAAAETLNHKIKCHSS
jgi:hypothetical protein